MTNFTSVIQSDKRVLDSHTMSLATTKQMVAKAMKYPTYNKVILSIIKIYLSAILYTHGLILHRRDSCYGVPARLVFRTLRTNLQGYN